MRPGGSFSCRVGLVDVMMLSKVVCGLPIMYIMVRLRFGRRCSWLSVCIRFGSFVWNIPAMFWVRVQS